MACFSPGLSVICSSRNAAFGPFRTTRSLTFASDRATSTEKVPPSIDPARSAARRACSSVSVFSVIASMYGCPAFQ